MSLLSILGNDSGLGKLRNRRVRDIDVISVAALEIILLKTRSLCRDVIRWIFRSQDISLGRIGDPRAGFLQPEVVNFTIRLGIDQIVGVRALTPIQQLSAVCPRVIRLRGISPVEATSSPAVLKPGISFVFRFIKDLEARALYGKTALSRSASLENMRNLW